MTSIRDDARRVRDARRERAATTPAPLAGPALTTLAVATATAAVLLLVGAGLPAALLAVAGIALVSAGAAHRTTASLLAGFSLWLIRPYRPGERVRLYLRERRDTVDAEVVRIGLLNTVLMADTGMFVVANTRLLRAAPECRAR